ncbi:MAG: CocE/NonD family hydrolase [Microbacteriaceae bacterium]|nr:CocE/NonD family hydrolase [Microbacteriaceae bacterium]
MTIDRPWKRPGAREYAKQRIGLVLHPPVRVTDVPPEMRKLSDLPVATRDGTKLRVNVYLPDGDGPFPVILSAHPYGKDATLPKHRRNSWKPNFQYRLMRQPTEVSFSSETGWEAPDPAWWTSKGYAVVNADLRGAGTSEGKASLLSDQEGEDVFDLIQWAGSQPWSTGAVGMLGVSYLAITQFKAAALQPAALKAICPWEGFTDAYRDFFAPGGVIERGFTSLWLRGVGRTVRMAANMSRERDEHPLRDDWWKALAPALEKIEVPMLVCTSFSDHNLHSRGSWRAFERASSAEKFAWTHRGGKWATFYGEEAKQVQLDFFDRYLKGSDAPPPPRVRLEVRESRDVIAEVREEKEWPLARTNWTRLYLGEDGALVAAAASNGGTARFRSRRNGLSFDYRFDRDTELSGPASLKLSVSLKGAEDANLFAGIEKWTDGKYVPFEGSYGYGRDRIAVGWQRLALRRIDPELSTEFVPVPSLDTLELPSPGEIVPVQIALSSSSTLFRAGDTLRLVIAGRWLAPHNPLTGHFPAWYEASPRGTCEVHWGGESGSSLLVPIIP